MSTNYISRSGGFQLKEAIETKPKSIKRGSEVLYLKSSVGTLTKDKIYIVRNHFCFWNVYGEKGKKYGMWDQFITIKNDYGYTVKVNLSSFYVVPENAIEVMYQTI